MLLLAPLASQAAPSAKDIETSCKNASTRSVTYSMCLDEKLKTTQTSYDAWIQSREIELEKVAKDTGRESIIYEFKKSNDFYKQFIESQCRRVFFENQSKGNAADRYRVCKIRQMLSRIEQMEQEAE
ncbi:hypothetical protein C2869_18595 [Saccharobesus litoralis]|uniref:Lysozyme inhibitor LprI N-terminal domain-containing protein n=2 Tax=Saccharobesus litoralis TaxID=2172099 RepID=A0A2S0VVR5_9ALTE|nr:hypothetical protein C2869_18595 [Saccharobesus litoralis]